MPWTATFEPYGDKPGYGTLHAVLQDDDGKTLATDSRLVDTESASELAKFAAHCREIGEKIMPAAIAKREATDKALTSFLAEVNK